MTTQEVGQGRAVANTLLAMGLAAALGAGAAFFAKLDLQFIDASAMAAFSGLMMAAGFFQHWLVRSPLPVLARVPVRHKRVTR